MVEEIGRRAGTVRQVEVIPMPQSPKAITPLPSRRAAKGTPKTPKRGTRAESLDIFQVLRERIANQELPPGSKLKEQDLAAEFGVSRSRVREVCNILEQRGLIERTPNRGVVVTRLTAKQVFELYDMREVLEGLAVRLATRNNPPESWDDLVAMFGEPAQTAIESGDFEAYAQMLNTFRRRMIAGCDNALLAAHLDTLLERTAYLVLRLIMVPGRAVEGLRDHRALLDAMRRGDAEEAERIKRANIRAASECFRRYQKFLL